MEREGVGSTGEQPAATGRATTSADHLSSPEDASATSHAARPSPSNPAAVTATGPAAAEAAERRHLAALSCGAALLSFLLAAGSALACVEACFVVSLAFAQRARLLLLAALVRLAAQGRRARDEYVPAAAGWLVSLPSSMEELQQRAAYQANVAGLQLEQAMTDGWARYLSLRRRWLRGGTGGGGSSFSGRGAGHGGGGDARGGSGGVASERGGLHGIQEWADESLAAANQRWVAWQLRTLRRSRAPPFRPPPPAAAEAEEVSAEGGKRGFGGLLRRRAAPADQGHEVATPAVRAEPPSGPRFRPFDWLTRPKNEQGPHAD